MPARPDGSAGGVAGRVGGRCLACPDEPMASQSRVLIADGLPLFRDGLARAVLRDPALQLVAEVDSAAAAVAAIRRLAPDVAVLDAALGAVRVSETVAQHGIATRVIVLTATVNPGEAFAAAAAGAHG